MLAFRLPVPPPQSLPALRDPPAPAHAKLGGGAPDGPESPRSPQRDHLQELCGSSSGYLLASSPLGGAAEGLIPPRPHRPPRFPASYKERLAKTSRDYFSGDGPQRQESEHRLAEGLWHDEGRVSTDLGGAGGEAHADPAPAWWSDDYTDEQIEQIVRPLSELPDPQLARERLAAFYLPIQPLLSIEALFGDKESDEREQALLRIREAAKSKLGGAGSAPVAAPSGAAPAGGAAVAPTGRSPRSPARGSPDGLARQALSCPALPRPRGGAARAERMPLGPTSSTVRTVLAGGWTCQEVAQRKPAGSTWRPAAAPRPGASPGAAPSRASRSRLLGGSELTLNVRDAGDDAAARPRLPAGSPELWEGRSGLASVRDLLDGYAANPLGSAVRPAGPSRAGPRGGAAPDQGRPDSRGLSGFLESYVERQRRIEQLLADGQAPSPPAPQPGAQPPEATRRRAPPGARATA